MVRLKYLSRTGHFYGFAVHNLCILITHFRRHPCLQGITIILVQRRSYTLVMAEVAGVALGAASLAIQLLDGAVKGKSWSE